MEQVDICAGSEHLVARGEEDRDVCQRVHLVHKAHLRWSLPFKGQQRVRLDRRNLATQRAIMFRIVWVPEEFVASAHDWLDIRASRQPCLDMLVLGKHSEGALYRAV